MKVEEDFGIDWDGPIPDNYDNTVTVNEINSPLNESQLQSLTDELARLSSDTTEECWRMQFIFAKQYIIDDVL